MAECIQNKRSIDGKEKYPSKASISLEDEEWYECDEPSDGPLAADRPRSPSIVFDGEGIIIKGKSSLKKMPSPQKVNVCFKEGSTEIPMHLFESELDQDDFLSVDENHLSTISSARRDSNPKTQVYRAGTPAFRKGSPLPTSELAEDFSSDRLGTDHLTHGTMHRAGTPIDKDGEFMNKVNDLNDMLKP